MAKTEQLRTIAARLLPDLAPDAALAQRNLFLGRVMSAGTLGESRTVEEHFGMAAFREVLDAPPSNVFDRESWSYWHVKFGLEVPRMPDSFFTGYQWLKDRATRGKWPPRAEMPVNQPAYPRGVVRSYDEMPA